MRATFAFAAVLLVGFAAVLLVGLTLGGCGGPDKTKVTTADKKPREDPWLKAAISLRDGTDAGNCRRVLNELNQAFSQAPPEGQRVLSDADAVQLQAALNLTDADLKELRASGYTPLDPNHLADALYLRDVARSLDAAKLSAAEKARLAFEWVCRQVVLNPWATALSADVGQPNPPLPPTYVLRRGWGSGLERMLVFVALAQQMELDAYLIGPPEAAGRGTLYGAPGREKEFPRGPFWALGVRDGTDILLFDPWKEQALPGKNGRPATLAEVRANPRDLAIWLDNKDFKWDVTEADLKTGEPYLATSLSAVAPRMKTLEEKLGTDIGAKVYFDTADAKRKAALAANGSPVRFYSPAKDPYSPTRALYSFLPAGEGGSAVDTPTQQSLYVKYLFDQLPKGTLFAIPKGFEYSEPQQRLVRRAVENFGGAFLSPPTPREKLQRGQFVEVTNILVTVRDQFAKADPRIRGGDPTAANAATKDWIEKLNVLYDRFNVAGPQDQAELRGQIEELWKPTSPVVNATIGAAIAQPGVAEATFLLALSKHEQAERSAARAKRLAATPADTDAAKKALAAAKGNEIDAWSEARDWWGRYEQYLPMQSPNFPGRAELVKRLADRANAAPK